MPFRDSGSIVAMPSRIVGALLSACGVRHDPAYLRQFFRFGVTGFVNLGVDFCLFAVLLYVFEAHLILANTVGYLTGVLNSFLMNRYWTFSEAPSERAMGHQFSLFLLFNLIGLGLSNLTVWFLSEPFNPIVAKIAAVILVFFWNFSMSRRYVFHGHKS